MDTNVPSFSSIDFSLTLVHDLSQHSDSVLCLVVGKSNLASSPNGLLFTGSQDNTIRVWDLYTFQCIKIFEQHSRSVISLFYLEVPGNSESKFPNRLLLSSSRDNTVRIWDVDTLQLLVTIVGFNSCIFSLTVLELTSVKDLVMFGGCFDTKIVRMPIYKLVENSLKSDLHLTITISPSNCTVLDGHEGYVYSVLSCPNSRLLVSASGDCSIRVWKVSTSRLSLKHTLTGHTNAVVALCVLGESLLFSGSKDTTVKIWDLKSENLHCIRTLIGHKAAIVSLQLVSCGKYLLSSSVDGLTTIWDTYSFRCLGSAQLHQHYQVMAFSVSDKFIFSGSIDKSVQVWKHPTNLLPEKSETTSTDSLPELEQFRISPSSEPLQNSRTAANLRAGANSPAAETSVSGILSELHLNDYQQIFEEQKIDMSSFFLLTEVDLKEMSLPIGPRRKILAKIAKQFQCKKILTSSLSENLVASLRQFVALRTISVSPGYKEECWRGAKFLQGLLEDCGAETKLVQGRPGKNPVVLGKFSNTISRTNSYASLSSLHSSLADQMSPRSAPLSPRSTPLSPISDDPLLKVVFYGHYDVQDVSDQLWDTDPFELAGKNGYLYGRGVTDNKGPVAAVAFAVKQLMEQYEGECPVEVVMIVEGEEESDSQAGGFSECVSQNMEWLEGCDVIVSANSYWLGDTTPCLTYGMRGVIHFEICVEGPSRDLHSGVHGGTFNEPVVDLIQLLAKLIDCDGNVLIPGFFDDVRPLTEHEKELYEGIDFDTVKYKEDVGVDKLRSDDSKQLLMNRWRQPTFSIHAINASSPSLGIISKHVQCNVSMRIVPDQSIDKLTSNFTEFVKTQFHKLGSGNRIQVTKILATEYWLGNPRNRFYSAAEEAIKKHWNVSPMYVREGGTMPAARFLEDCLQAPTVQIPFGQGSDQAHLENERIRLENLLKGVKIFKSFLQNLFD